MMRSWLPGRPPWRGRPSDPSPPVAGGTLLRFADRKNPGRGAPPRRPRRSPVACLLLAALVLPLAGLFAPDAEAQSTQVLVSNIGQATHSNNGARTAQPFTTGTNTAGYGLTSVETYTGNYSSTTGILVRIAPSASGGGPDLSSSDVFTLTNPATVNTDAINTYSAPADKVLAAATTYYVVITSADGNSGSWIGRTSSQSEDSNPATGWSIGNSRWILNTGSTSWTETPVFPARIRINGTIKTSAPTDTTAPRVTSIERRAPSPTNLDTVDWIVTFDEAVKNVDATDFELSNTSATLDTYQTQPGTPVHIVEATGGDLAGLDATVTLSFASNQNIQDLASNPLANTMPTGTNDDMIIMDNTAPTVTITAPPTSNDEFEAMFTFNEPVFGFALGDITLTNADASDFMGAEGATTYTATITRTANSEVTLDVAADVAMDRARNGNTAAVQVSSTYRAPTTNTPPTATDSNVRTNEDTAHTFGASQFSFSDTDTGDALASVKIITLPAAGTGTLDFEGTPIPASDLPKTVTATELAAGELDYTPPEDAYGDAYASFTYRVNDGTDDSALAYTMTVNVSNVNDELEGSIVIVGTPRVGATLMLDKSGLMDADGLPANDSDYYVQWLDQNNSDHHDGDGEFTYRLITSDAGRSFTVDLSFTDLGGEDEKITSAVFPEMGSILANAPPAGADNAVRIAPDGEHTFTIANFGFTDTDATDMLASVIITSLPSAGMLTRSGVEITTTEAIFVRADIEAGLLKFVPGAGESGDSYASFEFLVSDGLLRSSGNTMTINVNVADTTAPRVTSIERNTPTTSPTNADNLIWRVTFNEDVQNVGDADFEITGTTETLTLSAAAVSGSASQYDVTVGGADLVDLDATLTLSFATGQDIEDLAGNDLTDTARTGTDDNTYKVDNTAPTVTKIERRNPTTSPTNAFSLAWKVTFSEGVRNVTLNTDSNFEFTGVTAGSTGAIPISPPDVYSVEVSGGDLADLTGTVTFSFKSPE